MQARFSEGQVRWALGIALGARVAVALLLVSLHPSRAEGVWRGTWARWLADAPSYLDPIEGLLSTGHYSPDWRLPGYAFAYLLPRLLLEPVAAANALVVIQVLVSSIAVVVLTGVAMEIERDRRVAFAVFGAFAAATYTAIYDTFLATESLAVSALILLVWALLKLRTSNSYFRALVSGILACFLVSLRPVMAAVVLGMGMWVALVSGKRRILGVVFLIPLLVGSGAWGLRSLLLYGKFEPLGPRWAPYYRPVDRALYGFIQAFGGSIVHWNPKAEIIWFEFLTSRDFAIPPDAISHISFPNEIYTSRVTPETLLDIKSRLRQSLRAEVDDASRAREQARIAADLDAMSRSIRFERPLVYYVKAPLRLLWSHLSQSGTENLLGIRWRELSLPLLALKVVMSLMYKWVVFFGLAGLVLCFLRPGGDPWGWLLTAGAFLVPLLLQTTALRMDEYRYFAPSFPFALVFACKATVRLLDGAKRLRPAPSRPVG